MLRPAVLAATLALAPGCADMRIHTEVAPKTDVRQYRTFSWLTTDNHGPQTIIDQQVRDAVRRQLVCRGLVEVTPNSADFLIGYHVLQERKIGVADWGNGIYGWAPDVVAYSDGALIVDFIDPRDNRVFWRGSAASAIEPPGIVDAKRLDKAAAALVRRYPSPPVRNVATAR